METCACLVAFVCNHGTPHRMGQEKNMNANTINAMGIKEFEAAICAGSMTEQQVLDILDARIAKRKAAGKNLVARVVAYRNELVKNINGRGGQSIPAIEVPQYAAKVNAPAPTDVDDLIKHCLSVVGAAGLPGFIARLTTASI